MRYFFAVITALPVYSWAVTFYPPFMSPLQTTKGPGTYGKTLSDVRFQRGWRGHGQPPLNDTRSSQRCHPRR